MSAKRSTRSTTPKKPVGIVKTERGWRAFVRVHGRLHTKCFPPPTSLQTMREWREETRVRSRIGAALPIAGARLETDIQTYLRQVATMPTLRDRRDDLARWVRVFGAARVRTSITAGEIRTQLERWRAEGYAASTVNHRRTALMHLWSVLDGRSAPNPAKDVPRYRADQTAPRALSDLAVRLILDIMPESVTRARLMLLACTGWPPAQIAQLTPEDIRWDEAVFVRARKKGKGVAGAWLPLLPRGWVALREVKRLGAWGRYSTSSARSCLRRAAAKVNRTIMLHLSVHQELANVTPYQLRHSFLTLIASVTQDDRAVMVLAQHSDIRQTHRYTQGTADPRASAAIARVMESLT